MRITGHRQYQWQQLDCKAGRWKIDLSWRSCFVHRVGGLRSFEGAGIVLWESGGQRELPAAFDGRRPKWGGFGDDARCGWKGAVGLSQKHAFGHRMAEHPLEIVQSYWKEAPQFQTVPFEWAAQQLPHSSALELFQSFILISSRPQKEFPKDLPAVVGFESSHQKCLCFPVGVFPCFGAGKEDLHSSGMVKGIWIFILWPQGGSGDHRKFGEIVRNHQNH